MSACEGVDPEGSYAGGSSGSGRRRITVDRVPAEIREEFRAGMPRKLVMRAEIGAEDPFWTERGTLVDDALLPLSRDLRQRLRVWVEELWDLDDDTPEALAWDRKAAELHREVVEALGPSFDVRYDE